MYLCLCCEQDWLLSKIKEEMQNSKLVYLI